MPNVDFFTGRGFPALQELVKKAVINIIILFFFTVQDFTVPQCDVLLPDLIVYFQIVPLAGDTIERKKAVKLIRLSALQKPQSRMTLHPTDTSSMAFLRRYR